MNKIKIENPKYQIRRKIDTFENRMKELDNFLDSKNLTSDNSLSDHKLNKRDNIF